MVEVHQFVQSLVAHDAISTHARHLQRLLRDMGMRSEIYAGEQRAGRNAATFFRDYKSTAPADQTWLLYHLSTASPLGEFLHNRPEHVAVNYHNITPAELFGPWEPLIGQEMEVARRQFEDMAAHSEFSIGVSQFNVNELKAAGYQNTVVAPVLFDPADFEHGLDAKLDAKLRAAKDRGGRDWLFVGRVAPHKCQHDIIKAFAMYRQVYDAQARLHIVGAYSSHHYWTVLNKFVETLNLEGAVNLTQGVSNGELGAYYKNADVFVCLSEHEGFGVPLLEAMHNRVPVIAYAAAAVPETLGDGGLLLSDKSPAVVTEAVHHVLQNQLTTDAMIAAGQQRLSELTPEKNEARWRTVIEEMVEA